MATGLELTYEEKLAIRIGYFNEHKSKGNRKFLTIGAGYSGNHFGIDLSYLIPNQMNHTLSETLRITLQLNFT